MSYVCNSRYDCRDLSDEIGCKCGENMFTCEDGSCVSMKYRCDGIAQCDDRSDEFSCLQSWCPRGQWRCDMGLCIPDIYRCDGIPQCPDLSDEVQCPECKDLVKRGKGHYTCATKNQHCIN